MVVAIDIGRTYIKIGLVNEGVTVDNISVQTHSEIEFNKTIIAIEKTIDQLLKINSVPKNAIQGIGIGFPGLVDSIQMKVLSTNQKYENRI